jgi:predicted alpha/beta superfamily hydrolase
MKNRNTRADDTLSMLETEDLVLPAFRKFTMHADETGRAYEIFVYVPGAPPPSGFPVVYVLDANSDFVTVAETVRRAGRRPRATGIGQSIVVGVGYPNTQGYDLDRRYLDYTLGPSCASGSDLPASAYGGQDAYLRFLSLQLLPHISAHFPVDPHRRTLLGHSLAGYFVLEALARSPGLFDAYVSFSPSIWWDPEGLRARLGQAGGTGAGQRLYIAAGRYEQEIAPWQGPESPGNDYHVMRATRRMVENAREMAHEIETAFAPDMTVRFELGEQEDHCTVVTTLLCRALRFIERPARD